MNGQAFNAGLTVEGLSFHVGSQCINFENYVSALGITSEVLNEARQKGFRLDIIDIGGGFPALYKRNVPRFEKLAGILSELSNQEAPLDESDAKEPVQEEMNGNIIDDIPAINHFLTKGITLKTSKDKTVVYKRENESEKGYLGLDVEKLKDFIKNNFPEILSD